MFLDKVSKIFEENKDKIAYRINDDFITYKELWDKAYKCSLFLKRQGNSPVIIYGHKEINFVISIIACIISKRTYVPVESYVPIFRLNKIIESTGSSLILTDEKLDYDKIDYISIDKLDEYVFSNDFNFDNSNNIAYIIFTSGSTGEPKGVPISYDNLNNFINWISSLKPLCDYKYINVFNQASFSFDLSVADLYYSLFNGHTLNACSGSVYDFDENLFNIFKKCSVAVMTPTLIKLFLLNPDFNSKNFSNLKCIFFCGEILENRVVSKLFESFPDLEIINAYGPTEATCAVSAIKITRNHLLQSNILPVGEMNDNATDIDVVNGEIVLHGPSVFNGYLSDYVGGYYKDNGINYFKTGDIGFISDGMLYCNGRIDNQIKYKGYRIELNDIKNNILHINGVFDCHVIAIKDNYNIVRTIKAFVVGDNINSVYIKSELIKFLPGYMIPKIIKVIDRIPVNENGKIDERKLIEL